MFMEMKIRRIIFAVILCLAANLSFVHARVVEVDNPKVTVLLPPEGLENGKAIVVCPGGGYSHLAKDHEGFQWTPFFNNLGFTVAVLEYQLPNGDWKLPLQDVEDTFKLLTDSATNWKISPDKIGIMGFSAGGHLASSVATHPTKYCKPAFQILMYPVISMDESLTHGGSRKNFLGYEPSDNMIDEWSSNKKVTSSTSPTFIALSGDDKAVSPQNSLLYYNALRENDVPAELIIFPTGGHGWGFRNNFRHHDLLLLQLKEWLETYTD